MITSLLQPWQSDHFIFKPLVGWSLSLYIATTLGQLLLSASNPGIVMILSLQPWHIDHLPFQPWHRDHFLFTTLITFFSFLFYAGHSSTKVHNQVLCFILHIIFCSWKHETGQSILIHIMQVLSLNLGILPIIMISYLGRGDLNLNQDKLRESKAKRLTMDIWL